MDFSKGIVFSRIDFIIKSGLICCFETHQEICDLCSPILYYMNLSFDKLELKFKQLSISISKIYLLIFYMKYYILKKINKLVFQK